MTLPALPDGLVVIVKRECETCRMVVPVIEQLTNGSLPVTIYVQDDPAFPESLAPIHDADLSISWYYDIETVPTVLRIENGVEVTRTVGWVRDEWQRVTDQTDLGPNLSAFRPGCGSLSVDPDLVDELRVRFGATTLSARRVDIAEAEDEFEAMFDRGWTDGLPVVPPT